MTCHSMQLLLVMNFIQPTFKVLNFRGLTNMCLILHITDYFFFPVIHLCVKDLSDFSKFAYVLVTWGCLGIVLRLSSTHKELQGCREEYRLGSSKLLKYRRIPTTFINWKPRKTFAMKKMKKRTKWRKFQLKSQDGSISVPSIKSMKQASARLRKLRWKIYHERKKSKVRKLLDEYKTRVGEFLDKFKDRLKLHEVGIWKEKLNQTVCIFFMES